MRCYSRSQLFVFANEAESQVLKDEVTRCIFDTTLGYLFAYQIPLPLLLDFTISFGQSRPSIPSYFHLYFHLYLIYKFNDYFVFVKIMQ